MGATASPAEVTEPGKSFGARLIGVFFSPSATFADIARKPDFLAPLILLTLLSVAVTETMLSKIGIEQIIRTQIEHSSRASSMTPEQIQQAVEQGAKFGAIFTHVIGLVAVPIFLLIVAGLGMLIVSAIFGSPVSFKTALAVASYASMVNVLSSLMAIAMIFFGDAEHYNPQNAIPTNPGFFLDPATSKPIMALASSIDIFSFWLMALLAIGFSEATSRKVKVMPIFLCFFGLWVVVVLIKIGFSTLG